MKWKFLRRCAAAAVAAALLGGMTASIPSAADTAVDEYHDDWLHVENGKVVDMYGNEVWMTGCNWFGYNVGSQVFDGVWSVNMHQCLNDIADRGFNLLRVPMSTQILLQWKNNEPDPMIKVNEWSNPELTVEGIAGGTPKYSFDIWNMAVDWCRENGIKIMLDIHCATTNSAGHNVPLWYDENYSTEDWLEALSWVTEYYKDDDTIIAIDLKNEPHGEPTGGSSVGNFAKWDDSTDPNNWKYAAEQGAAAVLAQNPHMLIMVEGVQAYPKLKEGKTWEDPYTDYAHYDQPGPYYGAWWGANFRGVRDYPIDLGEYQSQLVYSPHDYGPKVYEQTWFYLGDEVTDADGKVTDVGKTFTRQTLLDDYWYDTWAFLVEENIAPLLMGEWGGWVDEEHDESGENRHWLREIRDYMIEKHIHHTFWCFNENSSDTGGLVYDNFQKWDEVKYEFVKPALWQTEDGKFISLDHTIPIGHNGITLSAYYGNAPEQPTQAATDAPTEPASNAPTEPATDAPEPTEEDGVTLWGDADLDGDTDILDVIMVNKDQLGSAHIEGTGRLNADVNQNDKLEFTDAVLILQSLVDLVTLPAKG